MKKYCLSVLLLICHIIATADVNKNDSTHKILDEVSVTAIKRLKTSADEAEAVTVLNRAEIEQLGAVTMRDISDVVPNFYMPDYGSRITSTIYVRGIGARMDQPSVGLNVDNVPYLNKDAYDFNIADISSVEMLRGPQSLLYGRNTMAGVINIRTLSPFEFQGWRIFAEAASGLSMRVAGGWYHKFNRKFGLSANIELSGQKGYFTNEYNKQKLDHEKLLNARVKAQWLPLQNLVIQNTASFGILRQGGYPYEYIGTGQINYNDTCFYKRTTFTDGLTITKTTDRFIFNSITSFQFINDNMTLDQDFLPDDYFTLTQKKREYSITEELVFKKSEISDFYNWLFGFFSFYKHNNMEAPVTFYDKGISELIESHRNDANMSYPIKWDTRSFVLNSDFKMPTLGLALYHESSFKFGNWLLTAGLRFDYERVSLDYHSYCNTGYMIYHKEGEELNPYIKVDIDIDDYGKLHKSFYTLLPTLSLLYQFPENENNLYFKINRGYKAGGYNNQMFSDVLQQRLMGIMGIGAQYNTEDIITYNPEKSWNYEIGGHIRFLENRLIADIALFYIDCTDQQLTMFPNGTTTGRIMTNAGKTRSFGGEISLSYNPTRTISLIANYGYTNARFRSFFNGINDFKGNYLPYAPSNTLFLQALYKLNLSNRSDKKLIFDLNMRGVGKIFWNEENSLSQNFYILLGASVTYVYKSLELKLWGQNLTYTDYKTFYFKSMGNEFLQRGRGVEGGVSVRYSF